MPSTRLPARVEDRAAVALRAEQDRLRRLIGDLAEAERSLAQSQADEGHASHSSGDVAADLVEQEMDLTLVGAERARLEQVEAALHRIEQGTYGRCERCGGDVEPARLAALPSARRCIGCAEVTAHGGHEVAPVGAKRERRP